MTIPNQLSLEALLAEDGMDCRAGLPEGLRRQLADIKKQKDEAHKLQERATLILASIAEHEERIVGLHEELKVIIQEYTAITNSIPLWIPTC
jgi:hypothetical protein